MMIWNVRVAWFAVVTDGDGFRKLELQLQRSCDMGVHLRASASICEHRRVMRIALSFPSIFCDERVLW